MRWWERLFVILAMTIIMYLILMALLVYSSWK